MLHRGRFRARLAEDAADLDRALNLRARCFRGGQGGDGDAHDASCRHLLIETRDQGALAACFRFRIFATGSAVEDSYSARFYDLSPLAVVRQPMMELGRFCTDPDRRDPDLLRLAFACVVRLVDADAVAMLFGCSSFDGADPGRHRAALARLAPHLAPKALSPLRRAAEVAFFAPSESGVAPLPPLLQSYLALGGWVSDHAVVDREMDTLHVFTGVEIAAIPAARARLMRALAA